MLRFADVTPADVHTYESAPSSPKRRILALPPPPETKDETVTSLGKLTDAQAARVVRTVDQREASDHPPETDEEPEEGSAEDIRRKYFPSLPVDDPALEWMKSSPDSSSDALRFDFTGTPIPFELSTTLPTHMGLHHHAEGDHAGYTLDDIFLLSRSTVPAQRSAMLAIMARIARKLGKQRAESVDGVIPQFRGREEDLRKRLCAAGVEAFNQRGTLAACAIDVVWECVVNWEPTSSELSDVELGGSNQDDGNKDLISSLPFDYTLPAIATLFPEDALPQESQSRLLVVLLRFAQHDSSIATTIVDTPDLLGSMARSQLLSSASSSLPNPLALQLLIILAKSSRSNAEVIAKSCDTLLRFVVILPEESSYTPVLATTLLLHTLQLYAAFARYGMYSHVVSSAQEGFSRLAEYVCSSRCTSNALRKAWLEAVEAWTICAIDPHQTHPPHDILWSQVMGWGWSINLSTLRGNLTATNDDYEVWTALWSACAAFLEGSRVNSPKAGEEARKAMLLDIADPFTGGNEHSIVDLSCKRMLENLTAFSEGLLSNSEDAHNMEHLRLASSNARILSSAMRLWMACVARLERPDTPPFNLPFGALWDICGKLYAHPLWSMTIASDAPADIYCVLRHFSVFASQYLRCSKCLPTTSPQLWVAQACCTLTRSLMGEEQAALGIIEEILDIVSSTFIEQQGWSMPVDVWSKSLGMTLILPFFLHSIRRSKERHSSPVISSPSSISQSTTQRLPSTAYMQRKATSVSGLPCNKDWFFLPLNHLLRSGESAVFEALPSAWNASETDIVRLCLLLAKACQISLAAFSPLELRLSAEESIFGCMRIFMLEHDQQDRDSQDEVYRDQIVGRLMQDILEPYRLSAVHPSLHASGQLESVASHYLGPKSPFFQFYTDFVALYDAVSFGHSLFGRLLLPPTSMEYAIDYRKLLWHDNSHILRNIRTSAADVLAADLSSYLWPAEQDAHMLSSYVRALIKEPLQEFLRLVAIHHVACNIWPDLREDVVADDKARLLFTSLVAQAKTEVVKDVVLYRQDRQAPALGDPDCFNLAGPWKASRLEWLEKCVDGTLVDRFSGLLNR